MDISEGKKYPEFCLPILSLCRYTPLAKLKSEVRRQDSLGGEIKGIRNTGRKAQRMLKGKVQNEDKAAHWIRLDRRKWHK